MAYPPASYPGIASGGYIGGGAPIAPTPFSAFGDPATFKAAATTQASDYDKIMQQYADIAKSFSANPLTAAPVGASLASAAQVAAPTPVSFSSVAPQTAKYAQSGDVTSSLATLKDLSTTGGYSAQDIADIRARDISPIRSIYANAQQNVERQRALSGGYSPNFNAVTGQLTRDEANQIGATTTAANAGIAQNVASNKIAAASPYASASLSANAAQTAADQKNADIINQINEFNAQTGLGASEFNTSAAAAAAEANANRATNVSVSDAANTQGAAEFNTQAALDAAKANRSGALGATQGMQSLYGTTPALTSTFGNQVMQAGQLGQNQQQINTQRLNTLSNFGR